MDTFQLAKNELENQETIDRLENIFMPLLAQKRKNNYSFIHYTSAENALNILDSKEIWMRSPACMNDYMEIAHGHQMLLNFFCNENNRKIFTESLDAYESGISELILNGFDEWWKKIRNSTFIASISEHHPQESRHGRLSMWRAYGSQSGKVGLIFNTPPRSNKKLGVILHPAAYFTQEELDKMLFRIARSISENIDYLKSLQKETIAGTVIISLILLAVCLKHPGFIEEKEWRLIFLPSMAPNESWIEKSIESIHGIPQIIYKIPLKNSKELEISGLSIPEILNGVLIGPTQFPLAMFDAFYSVLVKSEVPKPEEKIIVSDIPLRT
ncbi:MAG: DUF2971 domain-containing protein [Spongiibacteraceae bacterium]